MVTYRSDLPELPERMQKLPLDERGFPVPWFVGYIDGKPDFRYIREDGIRLAHTRRLCWLCGERLGVYFTFVVGPMCGINRVTAEPPSHLSCAEYAVKACPFLTRPLAVRNERNMIEGNVPGIMIKRNPGVTLLWSCKAYSLFRADGENGQPGVMFKLGTPRSVSFWARGRPALREEIEASVTSGYPILEEVARKDGPESMQALARQRREFEEILARVA